MTFVHELSDDEVMEAPEAEEGIVVEIPMGEVLEVGEAGEPPETMPGSDMLVEEPAVAKETDWHHDGDHGKFLPHFADQLSKIPRHSGQTTVGCEKAIAYLKKCDKELSRAIQSDESNLIDEEKAEQFRDQIVDMIHKLEVAHEKLMDKKHKKHKKASDVKVGKKVVARINDGANIEYYVSIDNGSGEQLLPVSLDEPTDSQVQVFAAGEDAGITKEASSAKIVMFEDPFLHSITRILINSHVSAGRNMNEVYAHLKEKYDFTSREELSINELLLQKGFPINRDLGRLGDKIETSDGKGIEFPTTYYA